MKRKKSFILFCVMIGIFVLLSNISILKLMRLPSEFYVNYEEVEKANEEHFFGEFINLSIKEKELKTDQNKTGEGEIVFKLFGFIPIKKVKVKLLPEEEVFVGGVPIGLTLQTDGAVVVSDTIVDVQNASVMKNPAFKTGDVIREINGQKISSLNDIDIALNSASSDEVNIKYQRNNQVMDKNVSLLKDESGKYKLGLWVRDDFSGVGTLTFVKKSTHDFAALGHAVTNGQNENILPIIEGSVYNCSLVDVEKGEKNNPGELRCVFVQRNKQGEINKNTKVGIFGKLGDDSYLIDSNKTALLGGRLSVKPGKAKIISSVSGLLEEYDVEIIKANFQSKSDDKSLIIRVIDKKLLDLTGGIVQGMSGSPILQNGKIVGAVTHVFVSDPAKGYGVYADWMLEQMI